MRKPSLEDKIQERLKGYSVQVDNQKLFESLGISEQSEKKKRFLWWFSGFAGILIVAVGIFLIMQLNPTQEVIKQELLSDVTSSEIEQTTIEEKTENFGSQPQKTATESSNNIQEKLNLEKIENSKEEVLNSNIVVQEKTTPIIAELKTESKNTKLVNDDTSTKNEFYDSGIQNYTSNSSKKVMQEESMILQNKEYQADDKKVIPIKDNVIPELEVIITKNSEIAGLKVDQNQESRNSAKLQSKLSNEEEQRITFITEYLNRESNKLIANELIFNQPLLNPNESNLSLKWSLFAYGGFSKFYQDFSVKPIDIEGGSEYARRRANTEKTLEKVHAGIQVRYKLNRNWSIGTGLQHSRYNTKHNYRELNVKNVQKDGIVEVGIDLLGDTLYTQRGMINTESNINTFYTYYNSLVQWEIPLSIWYTVPYRRVEFIAGITWNTAFSTGYQGRIVDENNRQINGAASYERNSMLYSLEPSLGMAYRIDSRQSIHLSSIYRYNLSSLSNEESIIEHNVTSIGLRLGYQWSF